jgi:putative ABC transport system permease protein
MSASRGNLKMAVNSLRNAKWRSFLTMLGIIIGIVSVVTIVGIGEGMKRQVTEQISHFGKDLIMVRPGHIAEPSTKDILADTDMLFGRTALSGLTVKDYETVKQTDKVDKVAPLGVVSGSATSSDGTTAADTMMIATSPDLPDVLNQSVRYGGFFDEDSELSSAVIGRQAAYELFGQHVPLGKTFTFRGQSFTVHGVFNEFKAPPLSPTANFDNAIFIPYQMAQHLTKSTTQFYTILAKPGNVQDLKPAIGNIRSDLAKAHGNQEDFSVLDQKKSVAMSSGIINLLTTFITAVAGISLLVGGIGIMNIMLVSVTERMHEIGIRKAVGATNHQILSQFMLESTVLSAIGGISGILLSLLINLLLHVYTSYQPAISWQAIVIATTVSVAVGIIFGTAPAIKAAKKDPIEALRHE